MISSFPAGLMKQSLARLSLSYLQSSFVQHSYHKRRCSCPPFAPKHSGLVPHTKKKAKKNDKCFYHKLSARCQKYATWWRQKLTGMDSMAFQLNPNNFYTLEITTYFNNVTNICVYITFVHRYRAPQTETPKRIQ